MFDTIGHGMSVEYREEPCRSALNRVQGMGFGWSLNPYMGCVHRCTFCYVRAFEQRADRPSDDRYGRASASRRTSPRCCGASSRGRRGSARSVAIGAATDPYQPAEGRYKLTRACLEVLGDAANPLQIITRGPMIVRDIDVLVERGAARVGRRRRSRCRRSTRDLAAHRAGHRAAAPAARALKELVDAGIKASVGMAPILPGPQRQARAARRRRPRGARGGRDRRLGEPPLPEAGHAASTSSTRSPATGPSCCPLRAALRAAGVPAAKAQVEPVRAQVRELRTRARDPRPPARQARAAAPPEQLSSRWLALARPPIQRNYDRPMPRRDHLSDRRRP